jgi:hypothetical protein
MRYLALLAVGAIVIGASANVNAAPLSPAGLSKGIPSIVLVQDKKQTTTEKVKSKVKRAWKRIAGYKFQVSCLAFLPITTKTCTETGKDREAARAKCVSQNPLCSVRDSK